MITKITNIAQLRARKGTTNALAETLGYYTPADATFFTRPGTTTVFEQVGVGKIIFDDAINGTLISSGGKYKTSGARAVAYLTKVGYDDTTLSGDLIV